MNSRSAFLATAAWLAASQLAASQTGAAPLLSEVYYDAVGSDDGQSFVELFGAPGSSLEGLTIEGINGSGGGVTDRLELSGVIPADGLFVVADGLAGGGTLVENADLVLDFDFQNGPDSVVLRSAAGVLDALGYGVFAAGDVFAGEGSPAVDPGPGLAVARPYADVDTDDNSLDFVAAAPSPGVAQRLGVPEPGAAALLALGGLAALRRRC